jgi:hypothetical protein
VEEIEIESEAKQARKKEGGNATGKYWRQNFFLFKKEVTKRERVGRRRRRSFFKGAASAGMK